MSTTLGLPIYVLTFLRHMEQFKDILKWSIGDNNSSKITLTLSWNFNSNSNDATDQRDMSTMGHHRGSSDNLLGKLHRSLSAGLTGTGEPQHHSGDGHIPRDVTALLEAVPKKHKRAPRLKERLSTTMVALRRSLMPPQTRSRSLERGGVDTNVYQHQHHRTRYPSNGTNPYANQNHHSGGGVPYQNHVLTEVPLHKGQRLTRNNSFHGYTSSLQNSKSFSLPPDSNGGGNGNHVSTLPRSRYGWCDAISGGGPGNGGPIIHHYPGASSNGGSNLCRSVEELDYRSVGGGGGGNYAGSLDDDLSYTPSSSTYGAPTDSPSCQSRSAKFGIGGNGNGNGPYRSMDSRSEGALDRSLDDLLADAYSVLTAREAEERAAMDRGYGNGPPLQQARSHAHLLLAQEQEPINQAPQPQPRQIQAPPPPQRYNSKPMLDWSKVVTGRYDKPKLGSKSQSTSPAPNRKTPPMRVRKQHPGERGGQHPDQLPPPQVLQQQQGPPPPNGSGGGTVGGNGARTETVVKCLDSCDKILTRYETYIN